MLLRGESTDVDAVRGKPAQEADRNLPSCPAFRQRRLRQYDEDTHDPEIVTEATAKVRRIPEGMDATQTQQGELALSVVVCTLGGDGVGDAVESIVASADNADRAVEVIVVWQSDEPPPDLDEDVRVVRVFNAGTANARNRGLRAAAAPLVAFVDDDEIVDGGWVEAVVNAFDEDVAGVFGPVAPRDDRGLPYCRYDGGGAARIFRGRSVPPWIVGTGGNMAFRRETLLAVGGFDVLFGPGSVARSAEDTEVILRLLRSGHALLWTPDVVVYHPTKTEAERLASRFPYAYGMGKIMRRHRDPVLTARYLKTIGEAAGRAARDRDRRRLREVASTARGFGAGVAFQGTPQSPDPLPREAPARVQAALDGARLEPREPAFRPDPHLIYFVGLDRLLHVYLNPTQRLRDGLAARERIRAQTALREIPELFALDETDDALWVLEERMRGHPPRADAVGTWFSIVAGWAARLAAGSAEPLRESAWWHENAEPSVAAAPAALRAAVKDAFDMVGELPARRLHGDFQPKNILFEGDTVGGVIDWEHAYEAGFPGLDILFGAVMARGWPPDARVVRLLARGKDPDWAPLVSLLAQAGLDAPDLRPPLLAALAAWAYDESVRIAAPGLPRATPGYGRLLGELGPSLM